MKQKSILMVLALVLLGSAAGLSNAQSSKTADRPNGGTLNYGEYGRPATLDPITSNEMISMRLSELIFNGLVGINERQEIVPELAERWDASKDGRTFTFYLRKDVTWQPKPDEEAKPFTAKDVEHAVVYCLLQCRVGRHVRVVVMRLVLPGVHDNQAARISLHVRFHRHL